MVLRAWRGCFVAGFKQRAYGSRAGVFMLGNTLPYYFALQNAQNNNYLFENKKTLNNSRKISMAVFDEVLPLAAEWK